MRADHFDRHRCHRIHSVNSGSFPFNHSTKGPRSQLFALTNVDSLLIIVTKPLAIQTGKLTQLEAIAREFPSFVVRQQLGLFIDGQIWIDAVRVPFVKDVQLIRPEEFFAFLIKNKLV